MKTNHTTNSNNNPSFISTEGWDIKPRCERTQERGWLVTYGDGERILLQDKEEAYKRYKEIKGRKCLSACDAGYIVPLIGE